VTCSGCYAATLISCIVHYIFLWLSNLKTKSHFEPKLVWVFYSVLMSCQFLAHMVMRGHRLRLSDAVYSWSDSGTPYLPQFADMLKQSHACCELHCLFHAWPTVFVHGATNRMHPQTATSAYLSGIREVLRMLELQ